MSTDADLLDKYLSADGDGESALGDLCANVLLPHVRVIVRGRLWGFSEYVEDVAHDVLMRLVPRLRQLRGNADRQAIADLTKWTTAAAVNGSSAFLRKEHPIRTHLANVLRYRFEKSTVFSMWKTTHGRLLCGWRKCRGVTPLTETAFRQLLALPRVADRMLTVEPEYDERLRRALVSLFACANGPIYFRSVVSVLISRSASRNSRNLAINEIPEPVGEARADELAVRNKLLQQLWDAVMALPRAERIALLLNLRGTQGVDAWWEHAVVPRSVVAAAVELPPEELGRLPLNDLEIADLLKLEDPHPPRRRQDVINLRRDAKRYFKAYLEQD